MKHWMKPWKQENTRRNTIVQIVIVFFAVLMILRVYPYGHYRNHDWSKQSVFSEKTQQVEWKSLTQFDKRLQMVHFTRPYLYQIRIYCNSTDYTSDDYVYFRLYNDNFSCVFSEEVGCNLIARQGYLLATPDMEVVPGQDYYYEIIVAEKRESQERYAKVLLPVANPVIIGQQENGILYVDGIITTDQALLADFDYARAFAWWQIIGLDLLVLTAAVGIYVVVLLFLSWFDEQDEEKRTKAIRYSLGVLGIAMFCTAFVYCVILNRFGGATLDLVVYSLGLLTALGWYLYMIWSAGKIHKAKRNTQVLQKHQIIELTWRNAIQIVGFSLLYYSLCQYVNADREYVHIVNTRWMLIYMGIILLANYSYIQFINKWHAGWLILSLPGSIIYCCSFGTDLETEIARLSSAVVVIWGLVVIGLIRYFRRDIWRNIRKGYFAVWIVFIVSSYLFKFEKNWVFAASLPFLALLLQGLGIAQKKRLVHNMAYGILGSFWITTAFNLCYRPHLYWMLYRYSGFFHTVAFTGLYMSVVIGTAIALLFGKRKNSRKYHLIGNFEFFTLVVAIGYLILSMSRTAMLAVVVDILLVTILAAVCYKKNIRHIFMECAMIAVVSFLSLTMVYSATRMIPALVNKPFYHEIEIDERNFAIYEGEAIDSDRYMTVERFLSLFIGRITTGEATPKVMLPTEDNNLQENLLATIQETHLPIVMASESGADAEEDSTDMSNGRFEIFKTYLQKVSFVGNPGTSVTGESGKEYAHAHNSYIMVAFNFGIIGVVSFLILCAMTLFYAIKFFLEHGRHIGVFLVPVSLVIIFGFTSLTEWTFYPCNSVGYSFLLMIPLMMGNNR